MKSLIHTHGGGPSTAAVNYIAPVGVSATWNATEANINQIVASAAGTIDGIYVSLDVAPGVGTSYAFKVRVNGVDSSVVATVSGAATSASDIAHTATIAAGDVITVSCTPTSSPSACFNSRIAMRFSSTTTAESNLLGGNAAGSLATSGTEYLAFGSNTVANATETLRRGVCGTSGTVKNLYVKLATAPGAGTSRTFTVFKNGVATTLLVTISNAATTGSDTTHTFTVAAGDEISIESTLSGTPAASAVGYGATFLADTDGESLLLGCSSSTMDGTTTYYTSTLRRGSITTSETVVGDTAFACTLKKFYVVLETTTGAAKTRTFDVRVNSTSPANDLSVAITNATTGNDTSHTVTVADGDLLDIRQVPTSTPSNSTFRFGMVAVLASATNNGNFFPFF